MSASEKREIVLGDDFGDVVVKVNGAVIDVSAAGYIVATSPSGVDWRPDDVTNATVPSGLAQKVLEVGDRLRDGTVYAGISPDTGKPMYTTPADARLTMRWRAAMNYAANLDAYSHKDWRAPTKGELNVLFNNRAAIGGFNVTGSNPAGWYWSSTEFNDYLAWGQRFSDGGQNWNHEYGDSSLRCVR